MERRCESKARLVLRAHAAKAAARRIDRKKGQQHCLQSAVLLRCVLPLARLNVCKSQTGKRTALDVILLTTS